jgi:hypothetical protein
LTRESCISISKMIEDNKTIKIINLSKCQIDDKKADIILQALIENDSLEQIFFSGNELTLKSLDLVLGILENHNNFIFNIDVSNNEIFDSDKLEEL